MRDIEGARARARRRSALVEPSASEGAFLAEVADQLVHWPARNPVMRSALDRAQRELLRLARERA